jgi:hypothetical protein
MVALTSGQSRLEAALTGVGDDMEGEASSRDISRYAQHR